MRIVFAYIITLVLAAGACKKNTGIFTQLSASKTGIKFQNELLEKPRFNILYYLYYYNGGGVSAGDINNDGLVDLYFTANNTSANKLYLNKGNFEFEDITEISGTAGTADWCTGTTMADVNGDGLLDIYVSVVSKEFGLNGHNMLFVNQGNNRFKEQSEEVGLAFSGFGTQAAFFDYDRDGDLDCYLLNHSKRPHSNVVDTSNRRRYDPTAGDRLLRSELAQGRFAFTDVSAAAGIYQSSLGYGLGISVADYNNDGWPDMYVGNDFHENDYYYINNGDGSFSEKGATHFGHYSRFSMGNDAADFDNDGQIDIVTVDMLPPDEKTLKTYGSDENPNMYAAKLTRNGYQHQYSRNCLQRNNGNGSSYSDIALLAGVSATDWSWSPLFADFDNDGWKDLFISNGIVKRPVDLDYITFVSSMQQNKGLELTDKFDAETIDKMPGGATRPYLFFNKHNMRFSAGDDAFEKLNGCWNGALSADLNNDGALDLVVNSIDNKALILQNNSTAKNYLRIALTGSGFNTQGIGAKLTLFHSGTVQVQHAMPTRGFMSSSDPRIHFGLDSFKAVDSVYVVWPDGKTQALYNVKANQQLNLQHAEATASIQPGKTATDSAGAYIDITAQTGLAWKHSENDFVDFNAQYLLPHMQSTRGPRIAVADINNDGLDDFYACGASGQSGALYQQTGGNKFKLVSIPAMQLHAQTEEVDAVFADFNQDGLQDLLTVSGGYRMPEGAASLRDRLYLQSPAGVWTEDSSALPALLYHKGCVASADVDADGDADLFIGGLAQPAAYGIAAPSVLLLNNGAGKFSKADAAFINTSSIGITTSCALQDMDGDGRADLVVAGEWMPVLLYRNRGNGFDAPISIAPRGLWQHIAVADMDGDGKPDVLAGNWGLNNKFASQKDGPLKMYVRDFDGNGKTEQVLAYNIGGKYYPFLAKDELERAMPVLKKAYLTYGEVAGKTIDYLLYDLFTDYTELTADSLASMILWQQADKSFTRSVLPWQFQTAPLMAAGFFQNLLAYGGNFYGTVPYEGRYDAMPVSLASIGPQRSPVTASQALPSPQGEVRSVKWLKAGNGHILLSAANNKALQVLYKN